MKIILKDIELKMWEKNELPETQKNEQGKIVNDENGKPLKTGKMIEYTNYIFRDALGEKLEILSAKNNFREFENSKKNLTVILNLTKRSFQGKTDTKVSLVDILEI